MVSEPGSHPDAGLFARRSNTGKPRTGLVRLSDLFVYFLVRALLCVLQALTIEQCEALARALAWLFADVLRIRATVVEDNLKHAFPDWPPLRRRQLTRRMWRHLFLLLCEMALAQRKIHETNWREYIHLDHAAELVELILQDRAVVVVTAHLGNFELGGYSSGLLGFPFYALARDLDNPYLNRFILRFRQATGQRIFASHGTAELAQAVLNSGGTLGILGDHYGGPKGCWVQFFGRPASCHKSVALFALANRLPLAVMVTVRDRRPMQFRMRCTAIWDPESNSDPSLQSVPALTQWYTKHLEQEIRRYPDQYWWLHRRWKPPSKRVQSLGHSENED